MPRPPRQTSNDELAALVAELREGHLGQMLFEDDERFRAVLDLDGTVVAVNQTGLRLNDVAEDEFVGRPLWQGPLLSRDPTAEGTWRTRLATSLSSTTPLSVEDDFPMPEGPVAVRSLVSPVRMPDGRTVGFMVEGTNVDRARRTEQRLLEQERLRRLTFEQSYQLMAMLGPDGTILDVNAAIDRLGATRDQVVGQNVVEIAGRQPEGPRRRAEWAARFEALRTATKPVQFFELMRTGADGDTRALDCTLTPVRDETTGELESVLYEVHDRTDSYRAEERLRALAETIPQMLWISSADPEVAVEYFSPRWAEFTGRPIAELLGRGFVDLVHPDDRPSVTASPSPTSVGEGPPVLFRLRRHDGEYRWMEARSSASIDEATGEAVRWYGATLDITDQRQAELDARAQAEQLLIALELTGLGRFEVSFPDQLVSGDDRLVEIFGVTGSEGVVLDDMRAYMAMIEPEHRARVRAAFEASATPGGPDFEVDYPIRRPGPEGEEERRWLAVLGRVEFNEHGPSRMVGVVEDITDKRQEDQARVRLQKLEAMGTLASGIAHDFNNVIGAILSYARVAQAEVAAGESPDESLAEIARGALRAGDQTKRLLAFAREEPVRREPFDLGEVVREAASLVRPSLPAGIALHVATAGGLPTMLGDSTQLHQVVVNLVSNAGQAIGPRASGRIDVSVEQVVLGERRTGAVAPLDPGEYLRLRVVDDGPGIPEVVLPRIFDPFFTTKAADEGTGLGLAAVHSIVRNHGGVVAAEQHRSGGAMLTAYLPVQHSPSEPDRVPAPEPAERTGESPTRVLFVDDEEALVRLAYRAMPFCGCAVSGYTDPSEAAEAFAADPDAFDAVITDLSMPGLTGLELTDRVRAIRTDVPVVLTSGYMAASDQQDAERRGVSAILPKPCSIDDLAGEVLRLLGREVR